MMSECTALEEVVSFAVPCSAAMRLIQNGNCANARDSQVAHPWLTPFARLDRSKNEDDTNYASPVSLVTNNRVDADSLSTTELQTVTQRNGTQLHAEAPRRVLHESKTMRIVADGCV